MKFLGALAILLAIGSIGACIWWSIVLWHIDRSRRRVPRLNRAPALEANPPSVSVIIPAHNEGARIGPAVTGILAQEYPDLELIVVLDRCSDDTRAHAVAASNGDARVRIVDVHTCPADWAGKCHAAAAGAAVARGALLLFSDADVRFEPTALRRAVALARAQGVGLASMLPVLEVRHLFELAWQPVASFMLMRLFPAERVNRQEGPRPFANGQFLLFTREAYERAGGHEGVRSALLEDIAFATKTWRGGKGDRVGLFASDGFVRTAMYDSVDAFRSGWKRIFIESSGRRPRYLRRLALEIATTGIGAPLIAVMSIVCWSTFWNHLDAGGRFVITIAGTSGIIALLLQVATTWAFLVRARASKWGIILWPFGALAVFRILREASADLIARRPIRWGGRSYVLEPR